jgi:hypothetical protein
MTLNVLIESDEYPEAAVIVILATQLANSHPEIRSQAFLGFNTIKSAIWRKIFQIDKKLNFSHLHHVSLSSQTAFQESLKNLLAMHYFQGSDWIVQVPTQI